MKRQLVFNFTPDKSTQSEIKSLLNELGLEWEFANPETTTGTKDLYWVDGVIPAKMFSLSINWLSGSVRLWTKDGEKLNQDNYKDINWEDLTDIDPNPPIDD